MTIKEIAEKYGFDEVKKGVFVLYVDDDQIIEIYQVSSKTGYLRGECDFSVDYEGRLTSTQIQKFLDDMFYVDDEEDEF